MRRMSYDQGMLAGLECNIKDDRTVLDLLFGCLIDWGLPRLSLPYKSEQLGGCTVHTYNDGDLIACLTRICRKRGARSHSASRSAPSSAIPALRPAPEKINVFEILRSLYAGGRGQLPSA